MLPNVFAAAQADLTLFKSAPPAATATLLAATAIISILGQVPALTPLEQASRCSSTFTLRFCPSPLPPHTSPVTRAHLPRSFYFPAPAVRRCIRARAHLRQPRLLLEPCFICIRGDQLAAVRYRRVCHTRLLAHIRTHVGRYRNRLLFPRHRRVRRPAPAHHHRRILCCDP